MPSYSVTCPECRASLKSSKPIAAGTPLECPKCQVMFAAPSAKPAVRRPEPSAQPRHRDEIVDDVEVIDDDVEVIDDVEVVDDDAPPRRRPAAARKPVNAGVEVVDDDDDDDDDPRPVFKPKRKKGSNSGLVIALVAIGAVVLLGGGGTIFYFLITGGSGSDDPMAYVPADSNSVMGMDGTALFDSPFGPKLDEMMNNNPEFSFVNKYKQGTKWATKDLVQRVVIASKAGGGGKPIMIVRSVVPWDASKLSTALNNTTKTKVAGIAVYRGSGKDTLGAFAVPFKNIAVFAEVPDSQLEPLFKARGASLTGDLKALVDKASKGTVYMVAVLDANSRQQMPWTASMVGGGSKEMAAAFQTAKGFGIWATLGGEVILRMAVMMPDEAAAGKLSSDLLTGGPKIAAALKGTSLLLPPSFKPAVQELADSLQVTTEGKMTILEMKVKSATLETAIADLSNMPAGRGAAPQGAPQPNRGVPGRR